MERIKKWIKCILAIVCALLIGRAAGWLYDSIPQGGMGDTEHGILQYFVWALVQAIGLSILFMVLGRKDILKDRPKGSFKTGAVAGIVLIAYASYMLVSNLINCIRDQGAPAMSPLFMLMYTAALFLGAGMYEEFIFRGIFMNFIRSAAGNNTRKALIAGMTVSSVCFGLVHLSNLQGTDDVIGTIGQVIYAIGIGFYLAAIYARTKNIWFNVILHFFVDIAALLKTLFVSSEVSISEVIGGDPVQVIIRSVLIGVIFGGMGLFLIRKSKMPELT